MATVIPFRAVRPARDKACLVVSRSYEDYTDEALEAQLRFNPYSFLHIINPGYKFKETVSGAERFAMVRNRYLEFKENDVLIQDKVPALYIYTMKTRTNSYTGILAATATDDYKHNRIRKHEDTIRQREELFKEYLEVVGFNAEPVLLTYPDCPNVNCIVTQATKAVPEYEFTTTDRVTHYFWKLSDQKVIEKLQQEFRAIKALYIADGHHRTASSYLLSELFNARNKDGNASAPHNFFMSYLIPESGLKIAEFNRLIKGLNGWSKKEFLIQLDTCFRIENRGPECYTPSKKHHFSMYLDGAFYSLYLRKTRYRFTNALSALDTHILYTTVLNPILGIKDLRNDIRIAYGSGKNNSTHMKNSIDQGTFTVGFGMLPVTVTQMKTIADQGLRMPPKSTYIEPKLSSGLAIYEF